MKFITKIKIKKVIITIRFVGITCPMGSRLALQNTDPNNLHERVSNGSHVKDYDRCPVDPRDGLSQYVQQKETKRLIIIL